jgi:hypothetical protein
MKEHNNDNEELSFIRLGAATSNLVRYLQKIEDQTPQGEDDGADHPNGRAGQKTDEQRAEDRRRYVEQRLREVAAFERSYSAGIKGRR